MFPNYGVAVAIFCCSLPPKPTFSSPSAADTLPSDTVLLSSPKTFLKLKGSSFETLFLDVWVSKQHSTDTQALRCLLQTWSSPAEVLLQKHTGWLSKVTGHTLNPTLVQRLSIIF